MNLVQRIRHKLGGHPLLRPIPNDNELKRTLRHHQYRASQPPMHQNCRCAIVPTDETDQANLDAWHERM